MKKPRVEWQFDVWDGTKQQKLANLFEMNWVFLVPSLMAAFILGVNLPLYIIGVVLGIINFLASKSYKKYKIEKGIK